MQDIGYLMAFVGAYGSVLLGSICIEHLIKLAIDRFRAV